MRALKQNQVKQQSQTSSKTKQYELNSSKNLIGARNAD